MSGSVMALAEARAAWQRTANRCLVQEDAKRAPKLACCSSAAPSVKPTETVPTSDPTGQDIPNSNSSPFHRTPSYSTLSPNTKWWLQMQPNYVCQSGLMDEKPSCQEGNIKNFHILKSPAGFVENNFELVNQTSHIKFKFGEQCTELVSCETKGMKVEDMEEFRDICIVSSEGSKSSSDLYFDSGSSWVGTEKNTPWWRTADTEELAFLVAQRSLDLIENCDLPSPQNLHVKNNTTARARCLSLSEMSTSLPVWKSGTGGNHHLGSYDSSLTTSTGSSCRNLGMVTEEQLLSSQIYPLRDSPTYKRNPEIHRHEDDQGKAQLLEALRHSQTRARQAETVAKQAYAEKEHVVKLVFRQAQQLFAYKQWLQLLQLENMYFQLKNNKLLSGSPATSPWATPRKKKMQKGWMTSSSRNRGRRSRHPQCDVDKYAIVFALGLGLVGAGLLLGWTVGWMLPMW